MKLSTLLAVGACLGATTASAQFDNQLPLQYGLQQTLANPAALQDHHVTVGLASVSAGYFTPFSIDDAGEVRDGTLYIDPDQLINRLKERGNNQRFGASVDGLAVNYRRKGWQVGASHRVRVEGALDLPRGLVEVAAYGNAPYVGQSIQVMPAVNAMAFQEFGVHGAATLWDNLTVGARLKLLKGAGAIRTGSADARLRTDAETFATDISTNVQVHTAGFPVTFDGTGVDFGELNGMASAGTGVGVDLGFVYKHEDKWEAGLSIRDLGTINWTGEAMRHRSNGAFEFRGYEGNVFEDDGFDFDLEGTVDSVVGAVQFVSTAERFTTALPTKVQGTYRYALAPNTTVHGTLFATNNDTWHTGFGVGLGQRVGKWLHAGALAGMRQGGGYLGLNVLIDAWGPQFYIACDDVLAVTNLNGANAAHVRAGINLAFGQVKPAKAVKGWYDVKVEGINR